MPIILKIVWTIFILFGIPGYIKCHYNEEHKRKPDWFDMVAFFLTFSIGVILLLGFIIFIWGDV